MPHLFGDKLRYLRRYHHLSQTDLARQLGLASHTHLSHLEAHRRSPSLALVLRIAERFGIAIDYLLRDTIQPDTAEAHQVRLLSTTTVLPQLFGAKLRYLRTRQALTQAALAERLALVAHANISMLEAGRHEPSIELVLQIAEVFDVTTDYLLRDSIPVEAVD